MKRAVGGRGAGLGRECVSQPQQQQQEVRSEQARRRPQDSPKSAHIQRAPHDTVRPCGTELLWPAEVQISCPFKGIAGGQRAS